MATTTQTQDTALLDKALSHVDRLTTPDACWRSTWSVQTTGFPQFSWRGRNLLVHRVVWEATHGPIPAGMLVLHRCGEKRCARLDHLFLGTRADKGRLAVELGTASRGEDSPQAKLTLAQVEAIRLDPRPAPAIAQEYGITGGTVTQIKNGKSWNWMPGAVVKNRRPSATRLSVDQVLAIRADTRTLEEIAGDYGIHPSSISRIRNRRTGRWADRPIEHGRIASRAAKSA